MSLIRFSISNSAVSATATILAQEYLRIKELAELKQEITQNLSENQEKSE